MVEGKTIDDFLKSLGLAVEGDNSNPVAGLHTRLMIATFDGEYIVHCFRQGIGINEKDLEGKLLRGQTTFPADLETFAREYEDRLNELEILYHRIPPVPVQANQERVSYKVLRRQSDTTGEILLGALQRMNNHLYLKFSSK